MGKRLCLVLACFVMVVGMAFAQKTVSGTVLDAHTAEPIIGAAVMVKGTAVGAPTDVYGRFTIKDVPEGAKILKVTYLGMKDKEVAIKANVKIYMEQDAQAVDEVMVVAYGSQKRSAFTGAAVEVKSEDIASHVTSSATNALVGKVAGLTTTSSDGGPGSSPTIRIRGIGSMSASNTPLYIVDGAPFGGSISSINPQDIESITVLKDASSSAIYGARGANGVILITTKKGNSHEAQVTFDAKWGSNSRLVPRYDLIDDPAQYYETHYRAMFNSKYYHGASAAEAYAYADKYLLDGKNGGLGYQVFTVPEGEKFIGTNFKVNPNATLGYSDGTYTYRPDDWYDETFKSSFRQEYNVSVNGQAERLNYYANVSYLNDGGTVDNSGFERYSARTNVEYQAKDWLKLSTNMSFTSSESKQPYYSTTYGSSGNLFYVVNSIAPIYPLYVRDADGNIMKEDGRTIYDANQTNFARPNFVGNAVRDNMYDRYKGTQETFNGKWAATITPVKGLILQATLSTTNVTSRTSYLYSRFGQGADTDGGVSVGSSRYLAVNQLYTANYHATVKDVHNFDILAGYEQYNKTNQKLSGYNTNLFDPYIGELENAHGLKKMQTSSYTNKYMTEGFFSRLQYDYAEKYFFNASIRRDASSRFHKDNRWGTFASLGLAWQINKEKFLENATWIDLLKLKASWGSMGNDGISNYLDDYDVPYEDIYEVSYNEDTNEYSTVLAQKGNKELTWETNKQWNVGVDFSFFKYRLNGSIDFFHRKTTDMLFNKSLPLSSGISAPWMPINIGSMVNKGVELSLDGTVFRTKNFEWGLNFNLTHFTNEITSLDPQVEAAGGEKSGNQILRKGGSIYELYLVKFAGTDKSNGQALYYKDVKDAEGNVIGRTTTSSLDGATQYECGTTLPDVTGGFGTTIRFYDFDLTAQFSYSLGGKMYDGVYQQLMHGGYNAGTAMHKDLLDAWSPENPNSNIPRLSTAATDGFGQTAIDRFVVSSDYLALNNLAIGYTLPKSLLLPLGVSSVRVYVAGENLFLLTKRKGLDPRFNYGMGSMTSGGGLSSGMYAAMRSITAGITLKF